MKWGRGVNMIMGLGGGLGSGHPLKKA